MPLCLLAFFAALGVVWAVSRPYGATVDEEAQYIKALGVSTGDIAGGPSGLIGAPPSMVAASRQFRVPEDVAPRASESGEVIFECFLFNAMQPASCLAQPVDEVADVSYAGVYPPLPYALPGLAARLADNPLSGMTLARLASGMVCLAVLALCLRGVRHSDAPALSLLGVTVALSPAVLFLGWSMNPNGLEMVAGIAFVALCLRLVRDSYPPSWLWAVTGGVGFVLGSSRPLAFVWIFFGLFVTALLHGPSTLLLRAREGGRKAILLLTLLSVSVLTTISWNIALDAQAPCGPTSWGESTRIALHDVVRFFPEQVGIFGWGEVGMPQPMYLAWKVLFAGLGSVAVVVGSWRHRLATAVLGAVYLTGVIVYIKVTHGCGFPMGGRYVQPAFTAFPIMWGEVILLQRRRLPAWLLRGMVIGAVTVVGAVNAVALAVNARRYAVGTARPWSELWAQHGWLPAGGWLPWLVLTAAGVTVLIAGFGLLSGEASRLPRTAQRQDRSPPTSQLASTSGSGS